MNTEDAGRLFYCTSCGTISKFPMTVTRPDPSCPKCDRAWSCLELRDGVRLLPDPHSVRLNFFPVEIPARLAASHRDAGAPT